jgi:Holliday junction resolvase RusA-like endonuclease
MTRSLTITIPGRPPTPNKRRHWRQVAADNATWKHAALTLTRDALPGDWAPMARCRMSVVFVVPTRHDRDEDNLIAAQKPVLDGIVAGGAITDDSRRVIVERTYSQRYEPGVSATVYVIEETP